MKKHLFLIALICSILLACEPKPELPTVITNSVDEVTSTSAFCIGEIVCDCTDDIITQGFCWSTEQNPTLEDNTIEGGFMTLEAMPDVDGIYFEATLTGLTAATEYYVRAYATNSEGVAYGDNFRFVTLEEIPEDPYNGHEYVDMGFPSGVKWATCNVGATTPDGYGEHYAWGEIETKEEYTWQNGNCLTYGKKLDDISGNPEYDVATAKWGEKWRMPRLQDMYELIAQSDWIWAKVNGVNGWNVVSKINGNHIFLPAAGFMNTIAATYQGTEGVLDQNKWGYYWISTPYDDEQIDKEACDFVLSSGGYQTQVGLRYSGFSIRPVTD